MFAPLTGNPAQSETQRAVQPDPDAPSGGDQTDGTAFAHLVALPDPSPEPAFTFAALPLSEDGVIAEETGPPGGDVSAAIAVPLTAPQFADVVEADRTTRPAVPDSQSVVPPLANDIDQSQSADSMDSAAQRPLSVAIGSDVAQPPLPDISQTVASDFRMPVPDKPVHDMPQTLKGPDHNTSPHPQDIQRPTPPQAVGAEAPDRNRLAEEANMQLSRPPRLRSYPNALTAARLLGSDSAPQTALPPIEKDRAIPRSMGPAQVLGDRADGRSSPPPSTPVPAIEPTGLARFSQLPMPETSDKGMEPREVTVRGPEAPPQGMLTKPQPDTAQNPSAPVTLAAAHASYGTLASPSDTASQSDAAHSYDLDLLRPAEMSPASTDHPRIKGAPLPTGATQALLQQLAQIAQTQTLQRRDVLLNPQELGHVRLNVQANDTSVHLSIFVERPETHDLMRRHINELAADFRSLGYQDVSFDFSQSAQQDASTADDGPAPDAQDAQASPSQDLPAPTHPAQQQGSTLDLRI